jgi:hypothetical protein
MRSLTMMGIGFGALLLQACSAEPQPTPDGWKSDCVGRLQIGLPGEADVAARTLAGWAIASRGGPGNIPLRFPDEQLSFWGARGLEITHPLELKALDELFASEVWTPDVFKKHVKGSSFPFDRKSFRTFSVQPLTGASWAFRHRLRGYFYTQVLIAKVGPHFVKFDQILHDETETDPAKRNEVEFKKLTEDLRHRPLFTVPMSPGLCYPYLFLQDGNGEPRDVEIATTYRLKDHPDLTILLAQGDIPGYVPDGAPQREAAERRANFFWFGRYFRNYNTLESKLAGVRLYRSVKIAGRKGVESFVELTRKDGTIDWGYLISSASDFDVDNRQPGIMFYVIRNASVAKAKGKEPFGDEESFLNLARSIAATVKTRPTAPE